MNFEAMSDKAVLGELGRRVQGLRLNANMAQADVARKAGISRRALQNLEGGRGCTMALLIRVLRVVGKLSQFEAFLPEPGPSPLQLAKLQGHERQRASGRRQRATEEH
ncbi:MAG: helix-turn-helix domain-containing protein [Verrucomicrobia bacterium]|nr:helix-turn-helix domain-containing protein [Verrucomicrobiota bacterium]MBU1735928.1 helix-turn-helix domain-containing protein [Verrucomicrobiota bacterium]MBU1857164.1 helix-turn-helix domain-containing protein [Verrucomicrobiota bacterium]